VQNHNKNGQGALPGFTSDSDLSFNIVFDGGSLGNPGKGYGSYEITRQGEPYHFVDRMEHGNNLTNNQAEYMTLIAALDWLAEDLGDRRKQAKVTIFGDSKLVVSQINGVWKVRNANMIPLVKQAKELVARFGSCTITWHPRAKSVDRLGH
jgi:probable phosphoglycerate mutase